MYKTKTKTDTKELQIIKIKNYVKQLKINKNDYKTM